MRVHADYDDISKDATGTCLAIGNFDGLHLGHRAVIALAADHAQRSNTPVGLVAFDPPPARYFRPGTPPQRLMSTALHRRILQGLGVDHLFVLRFDKALATTTPADFVRDILIARLAIRAAVVGRDFRFGKNRAGDNAALTAFGQSAGFDVHVASDIDHGGRKASSSRIRQALAEGNVADAATLLDAPWTVEADVCEGKRRAREMGYATANLGLGDYARPLLGVYAVWAAIGNEGIWRPAVANYGRAPTLGARDVLLEVHILDFDQDLYAQRLHVAFAAFIRPEQKFASLDALSARIGEDTNTARTMLAQSGPPPRHLLPADTGMAHRD